MIELIAVSIYSINVIDIALQIKEILQTVSGLVLKTVYKKAEEIKAEFTINF